MEQVKQRSKSWYFTVAPRQVEGLDARLAALARRLAEHRRRRTFLLAFADAPGELFHGLVASQVGPEGGVTEASHERARRGVPRALREREANRNGKSTGWSGTAHSAKRTMSLSGARFRTSAGSGGRWWGPPVGWWAERVRVGWDRKGARSRGASSRGGLVASQVGP
jgi:hypothetical protein